MRDAGYVIGGWSLTGGALLAYAVSLVRRARRAARSVSLLESEASRPWE